MKNKVMLMAAPALLLGLLAFSSMNKTEKKSCCMRTAVCTETMADCRMASDTLRKDPICGMMADDTRKDTVHYKNNVYAFCSKYCKEEFVKNPAAHAAKKKTN